MVRPFHRSIRHAEVDLSLVFDVRVSSLLGYLQSSIEMLSTAVVVSFLIHQLSQLQVGSAFTFAVLELVGKLQVSLNKHLQFFLVHLGINVVAAHLAEIANSYALAGDAGHLYGIPKSKLVIYRGFLVVSHVVVDDTQVNVG